MWHSFSTVFAILMLLGVGCGDDRVPGTAGNDSTLVGGPCQENDDCDQRLCEGDPTSLPDGLCTLSCGDDSNCPRNSECAGLDTGWVCLVNCDTTADCRTGWTCEVIPRSGDEGTIMACIGAG